MRWIKAFLITISILLTTFYQPSTVSAHSVGQPPFFKVNDKYSILYFVPLTSLYNFNLPQDSAPQTYLINDHISFEIDTTQLPVPPEIVAKTKFTWNLGDGSKAEGLTVKHSYSKMGSFIIDVYANDGTTPTPQLIEKVIINILPDKNYQLPQAVIKVNGQQSQDPLTDVLRFSLKQPIKLDAGGSTAKSSQITSYFWDYGDQKSTKDPITTHAYQKDLTQVFPVLRVTDSNGFISDTFVEIENPDQSNTKGLSASLPPGQFSNSSSKSPSSKQLIFIAILTVVLITLGGFLYYRKFHKAKG
jgi:hypothetical protein